MVLMLHKQSLFFADAFSKKEKSAEVTWWWKYFKNIGCI